MGPELPLIPEHKELFTPVVLTQSRKLLPGGFKDLGSFKSSNIKYAIEGLWTLYPYMRPWIDLNLPLLTKVVNELYIRKVIKEEVLKDSAIWKAQGWIYYDGLENIFGYRTDKDLDLKSFEDELKFWISDKDHLPVANIPIHMAWTPKMSTATRANYLLPTTFFSAGGAMREKVVGPNGKPMRVNKTTFFAECTEEKILDYLNRDSAIAVASPKRELYKIRPFINTDLTLHVVMSIVQKSWENVVEDSDILYPFMSKHKKMEVFTKYYHKVSSGRIAFPADQKRFDQHIPMKLIVRCLRFIQDQVVACHTDPETKNFLSFVFDKACWLMRHMTLEFDGEKYEFKGGLGSGLRVTNSLGAYMNYLINYAVLHELGGDDYVTMGDDTLATLPEMYDLEFLSQRYSRLGVEVEPSKNYISNTHADFLRMNISKEGILGYPLRMLPSLLYMKPEPPKDDLGFDNIANNVSQYISRMYMSKCSVGLWSCLFSHSIFEDIRRHGYRKYTDTFYQYKVVPGLRRREFPFPAREPYLYKIFKNRLGMTKREYEQLFLTEMSNRSTVKLDLSRSGRTQELLRTTPNSAYITGIISGPQYMSTGIYQVDQWILRGSNPNEIRRRVRDWNGLAVNLGRRELILPIYSKSDLGLLFGKPKIHVPSTALNDLVNGAIANSIRMVLVHMFRYWKYKPSPSFLDWRASVILENSIPYLRRHFLDQGMPLRFSQ